MSGSKQKVSEVAIVADIADINVAHALLDFCPDIEDWPKRWSYEESDLTQGRRIVEFFKPFLLHLSAKKLAASTLRRHRNHLCMLGGEIIRRRQEDSDLCRQAVEEVVLALLEDDGGPLIWPRFTQHEQDAFDASCRKFYRFITSATKGESG